MPVLSRRDFLRLGLGSAAATLASSFGLPAIHAQASPSHINFGSINITNQLDPHGTLSNVGFQFARQVYDTLVGWNANADGFDPQLATAWTQVDDTTMEFTLREGVTFHDGSAFDAETVVFNVNRMLTDNAGRQLTRSRLATIAGAEAVDSLTVRITTTQPDPILLNRLSMFFMVSPATAEANADDMSAVANGTGYFRVSGYEPANRIDLEAYDANWRGVGAITTASIIAIADPGGLLAALETGEVDAVYGAPSDRVSRLSSDFTIETQSAGACAICSLIPAVNPALADLRVRQAINLAVNKEEFTEAILAGYGTPSNGQLLQPGFAGYNPALEGYGYDPDRARELLAEAGAEGIELNIATTILFAAEAEAVAGYLNAVGINCQVEIQDLSVFIPTLLFASEVPLLYWRTDYFQLRDIANVTRFGPQPEGVQSHFENETFTGLFAAASVELDAATRESQIQEMAQIMHDEAGALFLAWPELTYPHQANVSFAPSSDTAVYLWEVEKS